MITTNLQTQNVISSEREIIVMNDSKMVYDDAPREVFKQYKDLEKMGLAAPQVTYIMHKLKERGLSVDVEATTVEEAKESILRALNKRR